MPAPRTRAVAVLATAALVALTACSTKASSSNGGGGGGASGGSAGAANVKTGRGISGNTITLGVLTDLSGPFAALGKDVTQAQQLYWDQQNGKGGVCGKYQVKLTIKDHNYNTQQAVQLYGGMKSDILALQHTIGSPINTALDAQLKQDNMVNIPEAWARNLTTNPENAVVGATYDVEMINVLDYLLKQGKIKQGDKLGHIYFEGEYGSNGLAGTKYFASQHGMTVDEAQIKSTDTDMTAQVTKFKADGVKALLLTASPKPLASAASVAQQVGLDVPIAGNNPNYDPSLLASPAGAWLKSHAYFASPVTTFDQADQLLKDYTAKYNVASPLPSLGVVHGTADAIVMDQFLEKACSNGDLTPEGLTKAKQSLSSVETKGLVVPLDYSQVGQSPSKQSYILTPADAPGGAKQEAGAAQGDDVKNYKPTS